MNVLELLLLAVGLSMDAFSVSICKGLSLRRFPIRTAFVCGLWFGGFQALMPLIGYYLGVQFQSLIESFDHWIAFALLVLIGGNMLREAFSSDEKDATCGALDFKTMLLLAIATSIDALVVGVSFACLQVNIWPPDQHIRQTTKPKTQNPPPNPTPLGAKWGKKAEVVGGVILILIGVKILLEHLGVFRF